MDGWIGCLGAYFDIVSMLSFSRLPIICRRLERKQLRSLLHAPSYMFSTFSIRDNVTRFPAELRTYLNILIGKRVLTVGDGDFSFSAALAKWKICEALHATSLENRSRLQLFYPISSDMIKDIERGGQSISNNNKNKVFFGVDGTKLTETLPVTEKYEKYDVIIWNFPHVAGKQNIRHNRQLLLSFLKSAAPVLEKDGCILISLVEGQSGFSLGTVDDDRAFRWNSSWQLIDKIADSGLLLTDQGKFAWNQIPNYNPIGWRGYRGGFAIGNADFFCVQLPEGNRKAIQAPLYVSELHLWWNKEHTDLAKLEKDTLRYMKDILKDVSTKENNASSQGNLNIDESADQTLADVDCLVSIVDMYHKENESVETKDSHGVVIVLQMAFLSVTQPCNRFLAEKCRSIIEQYLPAKLNMPPRIEKLGNRVSKPYPWFVTEQLTEDIDRSEQFQIGNSLLQDVLHKSSQESTTTDNSNKSEDGFSPTQHLAQHRLWRRRVGILFRGQYFE